jgi:hypothetical protein
MAGLPLIRHRFVPSFLAPLAYQDTPLPIGFDKTISQPFIVALMTDLLGPEPHDSILEVGTGLSYQAAVLAELSGRVWSIEIEGEEDVMASGRAADREDPNKSKRKAACSLDRDPTSELHQGQRSDAPHQRAGGDIAAAHRQFDMLLVIVPFGQFKTKGCDPLARCHPTEEGQSTLRGREAFQRHVSEKPSNSRIVIDQSLGNRPRIPHHRRIHDRFGRKPPLHGAVETERVAAEAELGDMPATIRTQLGDAHGTGDDLVPEAAASTECGAAGATRWVACAEIDPDHQGPSNAGP